MGSIGEWCIWKANRFLFIKSLARGLERLLLFEGDVQAEFERSFQVDMETFGHVFTVDLKPMGGEIKLTNENKHGMRIASNGDDWDSD